MRNNDRTLEDVLKEYKNISSHFMLNDIIDKYPSSAYTNELVEKYFDVIYYYISKFSITDGMRESSVLLFYFLKQFKLNSDNSKVDTYLAYVSKFFSSAFTKEILDEYGDILLKFIDNNNFPLSLYSSSIILDKYLSLNLKDYNKLECFFHDAFEDDVIKKHKDKILTLYNTDEQQSKILCDSSIILNQFLNENKEIKYIERFTVKAYSREVINKFFDVLCNYYELNNKIRSKLNCTSYFLEKCFELKKYEYIKDIYYSIYNDEIIKKYFNEINNYFFNNNIAIPSEFYKSDEFIRNHFLNGNIEILEHNMCTLSNTIIDEFGCKIIDYYLDNNKKLPNALLKNYYFFETCLKFCLNDEKSKIFDKMLNIKENFEIKEETFDKYGKSIIEYYKDKNNIPKKYLESSNFLEFCLKNKYYDVALLFNEKIYLHDILDRYYNEIIDMYLYHAKIKIPNSFFNNNKFLNEIISRDVSNWNLLIDCNILDYFSLLTNNNKLRLIEYIYNIKIPKELLEEYPNFCKITIDKIFTNEIKNTSIEIEEYLKKLNKLDKEKIDLLNKVKKECLDYLYEIIMDETYEKIAPIIDFWKVTKLNIYREEYKYFLEVILYRYNEFKKLYLNLKDVVSDNLGNKTNFIMILCKSIITDPFVISYDVDRETIDEKSKLITYIYGHKNIVEYDYFDSKIKTLISRMGSNFDKYTIEESKNCISLIMTGMSHENFNRLLSNHINVETLNKIYKKIEIKINILINNKLNDQIIYLEKCKEEINFLISSITHINELINSELDAINLKNILINFKSVEQRAKYKNMILYFDNIMETIRKIYEVDANITLTSIEEVVKESNGKEYKKIFNYNDTEIVYYDLSNYEYAFYAHTNEKIESLVKHNLVGTQFLCLSPISNEMRKKMWSELGVIVGYDKVVYGNYIANSLKNTISTNRIGSNNYNFDLFNSDDYIQLEFKDSSIRTENDNVGAHSETNILRDGMYPSCVIMKGDTPSKEEIEGAITLGKLLKEIGIGTGEMLPIIKLQKELTRIDSKSIKYFDNSIYNPKNYKKNNKSEKNNLKLVTTSNRMYKGKKSITYNEYLISKIKKMKLITNKVTIIVSNNSIITNIVERKDLGASHKIYEGFKAGKKYLIKPSLDRHELYVPQKSYAYLVASKIQKIINPENYVEVETRNLYSLMNKNEIYTIVEKKENTFDFGFVDNGGKITKLTDTQVESFLRELILDHLIFNNDTKGKNFLYDINGMHVYGIDKEQSFKDMDESLDISILNNGDGEPIYKNVIEYIYNNPIYSSKYSLITQESNENFILSIFNDIIEIVDSIKDEDYIKLFKEYIDCIETVEEKEIFKKLVLNRKRNLKKSIEIFLKNIFNIDLEKNSKGWVKWKKYI